MKITISEKMGRTPVTVFHIDGRINLDTADELRKKAKEAYDSGTKDLLLDMKDVKSLTSEGLRAIHYVYKLFLERQADEQVDAVSKQRSLIKSTHLKILNPPDNIHRVLDISGFELFIDVFNNLEQALVSF